MSKEQGSRNLAEASLPRRAIRRATTEIISFAGDRIGCFPYPARVGFTGIEGVRPKVIISDRLDVIKMLFLVDERPFAREMVQTLRELPEGSCFVDAGAAAGAYALLAAEVLRGSTVVAVEPDPDTFEKLLRNIEVNRFNRFRNTVIARNTALEDKPREGILFSSGASSNIAPRLRPVEGLDHEIKIGIDSIDALIEELVIPIPTAIKIDVEGAEMLLFKGMNGALSSSGNTRHIFLELHREKTLREFDTSRAEVLDFLGNHGFKEVFKLGRKGVDLIHFER